MGLITIDTSTIDPGLPVSTSYTVITIDGAVLIKRAQQGRLAFTPAVFAAGVGGYDQVFVRQATLPNPTSTQLDREVYRAKTEAFEYPTDSTLAVVCRIPSGVLNFGIGEIGTFAQLSAVTDPTPLPNRTAQLSNGDLILLTISHFPMLSVNTEQTSLHRVLIDL